MTQNVYMASMSLFIPLDSLRKNYIKLRKKEKTLDVSFIHYPNARCSYWALGGEGEVISITPCSFFFNSLYNSKDIISREIIVNPLLLELNLVPKRGRQYFLVLLVQIDKVFDQEQKIYTNRDFCTELDLVNLKKAFFERGDKSLNTSSKYKGISFHDWLVLLVWDLEGKKRKDIKLSYSIVDVCVQLLDITACQNTLSDVTKKFQIGYFQNKSLYPINDYLQEKIKLIEKNGTLTTTEVPESHFVYGLLYANDNIFMANPDTVKSVVDKAYSNNKVEKFWADDDCIVHIKTNEPYYPIKDQYEQELSGNLDDELQGVLEMSILIYIKRKLHKFKIEYKTMNAKEIEVNCGLITKILCEKLFNQTEMDRRMDYFIQQFQLETIFEEIRGIVIPQKNSLEISFIHNNNIWILIISFFTLLVTVASLI